MPRNVLNFLLKQHTIFFLVIYENNACMCLLQHDCSCHFLQCYSLKNLREIENLKPDIITMNWQTLDNAIICGVFVVRHLESYMGNKASWSCGLRSKLVQTKKQALCFSSFPRLSRYQLTCNWCAE